MTLRLDGPHRCPVCRRTIAGTDPACRWHGRVWTVAAEQWRPDYRNRPTIAPTPTTEPSP